MIGGGGWVDGDFEWKAWGTPSHTSTRHPPAVLPADPPTHAAPSQGTPKESGAADHQ